VIVHKKTGTTVGTPFWYVGSVGAGTCTINMTNFHTSTAETAADIVLNFLVIKGVAA